METKRINTIIVDQIGPVQVSTVGGMSLTTTSSQVKEIVPFKVNGEMAEVTWYRAGNREYNGKYVIEITYDN